MNKNCPAMASPAEELVGEFLLLMSKRRRSIWKGCCIVDIRATNRLV